MTYSETGPTHAERKHLLYIVFFAFALRVFVWFNTPVVGADCYNFVHAARCFAEGAYSEGLGHPFPPLFPVLIALFSMVTGDYETAGKTVALLFGVLTVLPLYLFTRSLFGHGAAIFACFFLAINPTHVRLSVDIMRETTHIFFFTSAVLAAWWAIKMPSAKWYILSGLFLFLDYTTRAEGIGLFFVILPWLILADLKAFKAQFRRRAVYIVLFTVVTFLPAIPYFATIYKQTGTFHITKEHVAFLASGHLKIKPPPPDTYRLRRGTDEKRVPEAVRLSDWKAKKYYHMIFLLILNEFAKDFYQPLLLFLLAGLFMVVRPNPPPGFIQTLLSYLGVLRLRLGSFDRRGEFFVLAIFCLYFALYYRLASTAYYVSGRYVLPLTILSFIWAGYGFLLISEYMNKISVSLAKPGRTIILLSALVLAVSLPKDLKVKRKHELSQKKAGLWIKEHSTTRPVIMGKEKVAFYADGEYVLVPNVFTHNTYKAFTHLVNARNVEYIVFYKEDLEKEKPELYKQIEGKEDFIFLKEWIEKIRKKKKHLRLYRYSRME